MRSTCRHLRAHTYSSGRVVERCALNWAPAAPCDCPLNCERFAPKIEFTADEVLDLRAVAADLELDLTDSPSTPSELSRHA